jgi:branched-chain amino acid transport system permease protein
MNNLNAPINITNGPQGITLIDPVRIGDFSTFSDHNQILGFALSGPQKYYFPARRCWPSWSSSSTIRLQDSRIGRAWQAIREDEIAAKACRHQHAQHQAAGLRHGRQFRRRRRRHVRRDAGFRQPESFSLIESIMILAMVVLGGMGHIPGVILGAVLLTGLPEVLRYGVGPLQMALFGKMLVDPEACACCFRPGAGAVMRFRRPACGRRRSANGNCEAKDERE